MGQYVSVQDKKAAVKSFDSNSFLERIRFGVYRSVGKINDFFLHKNGREFDLYCTVFDENYVVKMLDT